MKIITNCVVKTSTLVELTFKYGLSHKKCDGSYDGLFSTLIAAEESLFSFDKKTGAFYITNSLMNGYYLPKEGSIEADFAMAVYNLREKELDSNMLPEASYYG